MVGYSEMFGIRFNPFMHVQGKKKQTKLMVSVKYMIPAFFGGAIDALLIRWIVGSYVKKSGGNLKQIFQKKHQKEVSKLTCQK